MSQLRPKKEVSSVVRQEESFKKREQPAQRLEAEPGRKPLCIEKCLQRGEWWEVRSEKCYSPDHVRFLMSHKGVWMLIGVQ